MNEKQLKTFALISIMLSIPILFFLQRGSFEGEKAFLLVEEDEAIRVSGEVISSDQRGEVTIISLHQQTPVHIVVFEALDIPDGTAIVVEGNVENDDAYGRQLIAERIEFDED
ncbi:MAG: hypothetical protein ACOC32_03625 [Nanoarchaeota archaeon]